MSRYFARLAQRSGVSSSAPRAANRTLEQHVETYGAAVERVPGHPDPVQPPAAAATLQRSAMHDAGRGAAAVHQAAALASQPAASMADGPAATSAAADHARPREATPGAGGAVHGGTPAAATAAASAPLDCEPGAPIAAPPHAAPRRQALARALVQGSDAAGAGLRQASSGIEPAPVSMASVAEARPAAGLRNTAAPLHTVATPFAPAIATLVMTRTGAPPQVHIGRIELAVHTAPAAAAAPAFAPPPQPPAPAPRPDEPFNPHRHYLRGG